MTLEKPRNFCRGCGEDFTSIKQFDRHRVGVHAYTSSEGLAMDPPVEDGRRCLDADQMRELGWTTNEDGYWFDPAEVERTREGLSALRRASEKPAKASSRQRASGGTLERGRT